MSEKAPIFETFVTLEKAFDAIKHLKWSGEDIDQMSFAGRDWQESARSAENEHKGNVVKVGFMEVPWSGPEHHRMRTAHFYCRDVGVIILAGPLSEWALKDITLDGNDDGLNALGDGLTEIGLSAEEVKDCKAAVREGKILVVIPEHEHVARARKDNPESRIRISDMAKYH